MAKTEKNTDAQVPSPLPEEGGEILSVPSPDVPDAENNAGKSEGDSRLLVVVCKGHTLYHDGNKYPASSRLRMDDDDAERLLKRGVVVKYDDLLQKVAGYAG
ncbi:hypothetical protein ACI2JI_04695 [Enterobacter cancerogenus]|uniref:hypothetical protein n=1 Tax=Enterobacter cancerogenus TaxID=69218 RepID=UPI00384B1747